MSDPITWQHSDERGLVAYTNIQALAEALQTKYSTAWKYVHSWQCDSDESLSAMLQNPVSTWEANSGKRCKGESVLSFRSRKD